MYVPTETEVIVDTGDVRLVDATWLFVPVASGETPQVPADLDAATGGELSRAMTACEFRAKPYQMMAMPVTQSGWRARRVALVGAGPAVVFDRELLSRLARVAGLTAREKRAGRLAFVLRQPHGAAAHDSAPTAHASADAIVEGLLAATFDAASYKTHDHEGWRPERFTISLPGAGGDFARAVSGEVKQAVTLEQCTNVARDLANEPGNRLRPREFAERAAQAASSAGLQVEVLDEAQIASMGMNLLLGVARGSEEPPRLLVMRHHPANAAGGSVLGLVGKGVTFDTGGLSIKPSQGMERMKDDMAGGAAVVAAMCAISRLQVSRRAIGVIPIAENMPSGQAIRPGDVLQGASGKTVEVTDTDAEGRLILADALWYARKQGATHLVDVATLTGACMVALGNGVSGLFGRPDSWTETVRAAAQAGGESVWPMPLVEEYLDLLRSDIADLKNVGGRPGGAITAALFLREFAGDGPWAHLDIAGTAWAEEAKEYRPKGPTGVAVKTLARLALANLD